MRSIKPYIAGVLVLSCLITPTGCASEAEDTLTDDQASQDAPEWWVCLTKLDSEPQEVEFCVDHAVDGADFIICNTPLEEYEKGYERRLQRCRDWFGDAAVDAYLGSEAFRNKFPNHQFALVPVAPGHSPEQAATDWAAEGAPSVPLPAGANPIEQVGKHVHAGVMIAVTLGAGVLVGLVKVLRMLGGASKAITGFGIVIVPFFPCVTQVIGEHGYDIYTAIQMCSEDSPVPRDRT